MNYPMGRPDSLGVERLVKDFDIASHKSIIKKIVKKIQKHKNAKKIKTRKKTKDKKK